MRNALHLASIMLALTILLAPRATTAADAGRQPNIVFIFIDDMGYGDLGCYGNPDIKTPRIDALAKQSTRFTQFYVASPICSPSRVGITTGQYPARHQIHSFLAARKRNNRRGMAHFLDPKAPAIARAFNKAGYATAHLGKWHMGGGRDVHDAPHPNAYGFDESLVSFEGLGDRILPPGGLSDQSAKLGQGKIRRVPKHKMTEIYVDRCINFITRHKAKPIYLHLWLNDVHDAHVPSEEQLKKFERFKANPYQQKFYAVLDEMDAQIGRLIDAIDKLGLANDTLVVLTSDNGPTAWPHYEREGFDAPGHTGGLRGRKWSLYEGGIREPLIVRWPGKTPAGKTNDKTVITAIDFFPTFCTLAGVKPPDVDFDGVDMSAAFLGEEPTRDKPIFWEYGRDDFYLQPARENDRSPNLAVRDGKWKLLMNADGSRIELYDLGKSPREQNNLANEFPDVRDRLVKLVMTWKNGLKHYPKSK